MQSPNCFIVSPKDGERYVKERNGILLAASTEDHLASTREAIVINVPRVYDGQIEIGDTIIVHHNTFKYHYDMKGKRVSSWNHFKDNLFFVDDFFAYKKKDESEWKCLVPYFFTRPIDYKKETLIDFNEKEHPNVGIVAIANQELLDNDIKQGDKIVFEQDSEYPFWLDGEKLYRMYNRNVIAVL